MHFSRYASSWDGARGGLRWAGPWAVDENGDGRADTVSMFASVVALAVLDARLLPDSFLIPNCPRLKQRLAL